MNELSDGERYIRCIIGESIDRAPYGVGMGWRPWPETERRWRAESGMAEIDLERIFGFDRPVTAPELHAGIWPPFEEEILEEAPDYVIKRDERGITLRDRKDGGSIPEFIDYPVKTRDDWERLKAERLDPEAPGRIGADLAGVRAEAAETGRAVHVGDYPWGVFGTPRDLMGVEELLIAFYTGPDLVRDIMQHLTTLWISLWEKVAAEVQIDQVHIWEDMSGRQGSLISPAMVEEFMMPCYDRIAAFAREAGARVVSVDTDGDVSELVPLFTAHGVNFVLPFEVQAGNDIREYRRKYPDLGIAGGLDKRALAAGRSAIDREVEKAREMVRAGRYVAGFDHLIPPDVPWENYKYAAESLREVCFNP